MWTRRGVIAGAAVGPLVGSLSFAGLLSFAARAGDNPAGLIQAIEARAGGRLGVAALDTQTGRRIAWRDGERFPMCSTFKLLLVTRVLAKADKGQERLDRWVKYGKDDLLDYAPVAREHLAQGGMTVKDLAEAAIVWSDNTCANLLLAADGGPAGVTAQARALGDPVTRLDRNEPTLNTAIPGDPRDTTAPAAMLDDMDRVLLGDALSESSREMLTGWMIACRTAPRRIGAGLPSGWKRGHKTGTGANGSTNDIAICWPPGRKPILLTVYFTGSSAGDDEREAAIADVARIVSETFV
ncbi:MAG: class A beta-lactamase [Alphaproteobacteria bacterium]|nr:class A beta-lactamase [Alphaproteobacteria bacterium]